MCQCSSKQLKLNANNAEMDKKIFAGVPKTSVTDKNFTDVVKHLFLRRIISTKHNVIMTFNKFFC